MAGRKNGLGRGLDAFFPDRTSVVKEPARKTITKTVKTEKKSDVAEKQTNPTVAKKQTADSKTGAMIVKISSVEPNMDQPRKQFDEDALMELSESIKQYGVLHPLLVSDKKDYYEIIAGERRWRAAKLAGLTEIPVIVKEFSEQELVEISLIENIQREDLNPVEEAMAYKRLIDEFHLKQDEIAERVGKSRTAVTNAMRLLKLSEKVQQMLIDEMISAGHARAILAITDKDKQASVAMKIFDEKKNDTNKSYKLNFYITDEEFGYDKISSPEAQTFIQRMQDLWDNASYEYVTILRSSVIDWKNENHVRVISNILKVFQDFSFVKSKKSDLYQLVFYNFASHFKRDESAQFLTPIPIIDFVVRLVNPRKTETIIERIIQRLIQFNEPQKCCA